MLSLEARKFIKNDKEALTIKLTGYCRAEDVSADNTVLSTQMFDLRVIKEHEGELRKATKKGILTKALDLLFNF
jgi:flagellar basal body L-ring protein FlgH